jgi:hypothetical protein
LQSSPARRFQIDFDARDEDWDISRTVQAPTTQAREFRMQRIEARGTMRTLAAGSWLLHGGLALSSRRIRDGSGDGSDRFRFRDSFSLKYAAGLQRPLLAHSDSRVYLDSAADFQLGKVLLRGAEPFARLTGGLNLRWHPRPSGADYRLGLRVTGGIARGDLPFDELFSLGLERDNDLQLRGHKGTDGGRKGTGPLGRDFLLVNWEMDKIVFSNGLWSLALGPFVDTGTIRDAGGPFGAGRWLVDAGVQVNVTVLRGVALRLSFGRDLRSGRNALHTATSPQ